MIKLILVSFITLELNVRCSSTPHSFPSLCWLHMSRGDCRFYKCFNERFQNCNQDFGFEYCDRFEHHVESMSYEGKQWLNISRICAMEQMWELDKDLRCGTVDQSLKEIHKNCEIEAGLCTTILWNDRNSFLDVANMRSGTTYFKEALKSCPADLLKRIIDWLKECELLELVNDIKDTVTDAVGRLLIYFG